MNCIFCQIAKKELPAQIVFENEDLVAFKDIDPKAPVHILIIPRKHIPTINDLTIEDKEVVGSLFLAAKEIAREQGVAENGYRLSINTGRDGGQEVDHLHIHLLGGKKISLV